VCPDQDPDVRKIEREVQKSIVAAKKQVNLLARRLLRAQLRLNELQDKQENE
jgi:hypothetical protein